MEQAINPTLLAHEVLASTVDLRADRVQKAKAFSWKRFGWNVLAWTAFFTLFAAFIATVFIPVIATGAAAGIAGTYVLSSGAQWAMLGTLFLASAASVARMIAIQNSERA